MFLIEQAKDLKKREGMDIKKLALKKVDSD